jgi:tetratricopeptide (TPR) repeat protein
MNLLTGEQSDALFGSDAAPAVKSLLMQAAAVQHDVNRAEALLWTAQALDPNCLATCFSLYKFYFYKGRLADAESAARLALRTAARRGGFEADWTLLQADSTDWSDSLGPAHFYLFSLKALAFIRLRMGFPTEATAILEKLAEIDPRDQVGAGVIREVAAGSAR